MRRHAIYETQEMAAALDADGYALGERAVTEQQCTRARELIDRLQPLPWDTVHGDADARGAPRRLDRFLNVFNRDPYWLQFFDRPGIIDLARAALGQDCHVIGETAWRCHPGFSGEALHADYLPMTWPEGALGEDVRVPVFIMTAQFYLNDVDVELGPTRVVAGSHRAGRRPHGHEHGWKGRAAAPVIARAGDCLVFRSDLWHAGGDNRTESAIRYLLQVHYGRRETAQHFAPYLDWRFDPHVLSAASKRQLQLLGDHEPGAYD